jgi:hypothetical protein
MAAVKETVAKSRTHQLKKMMEASIMWDVFFI